MSPKPDDETQDVPAPNLINRTTTSISSALKKMQWRLHFKFPHLIPDSLENRTFRKERDAKENLQAKIPLDEELRQACIWGVELYGPKEISTFYDNITRLGWARDRFSMPDRDVLEWVRQARLYGATGDRNVGVVYRPEERGAGRDYFAPMPDNCDYLMVSLSQITPSLTAVRVCFVLNEKAAKRYEAILNTDLKTIFRRHPGQKGYSIPGVLNQKKEKLDEARLESTRMVSLWFSQHLPGLFSGSQLVDKLPTGELITMRDHVALKDPREDDGERNKWANLLGIDQWFDGWHHPKLPNCGLILNERHNDKRNHSIVTLKTNGLSDEDLGVYNKRDRGSYCAIIYNSMSGISVRLAATDYLKEIGRRVREARESISQNSRDRSRLISTIDRLETFYREAIGDPLIATELALLKQHNFDWDCEKFTRKRWGNDETIELPKALRRFTKKLAQDVLADGASARQLFQEFASTLSTRESIRTQKKMERLTIVAIGIAAISLLITLLKK